MKVELLANMGAYLQLLTPGIPLLGQTMFNGIYKMDAYDFTCTGVFTTTTPTDAYRGAGRPEATFAIERMLDELAAELSIDPMELRRRELDPSRGIPVHHRSPARPTTAATTRPRPPGPWSCSTTTVCARNRHERRRSR